jgi:hypothetical protein
VPTTILSGIMDGASADTVVVLSCVASGTSFCRVVCEAPKSARQSLCYSAGASSASIMHL